ncbi:MAG TPA: hypothetical protein VGD22_16865 [Sphingobacteriaceae bacterium]
MNKILRLIVTIVTLHTTYTTADAQIIVNGHNPSKFNRGNSGPANSFSISYGYVIWVDGNNVPLPGYSAPEASYHFENFDTGENNNGCYAFNAGYERRIAEYLSLKLSFITAKLVNGIILRPDLNSYDKSRISQLGLYGRYSLSKNSKKRMQLQWLAGPELIYVKKDVLIDDYVLDENSTPQQYHQNITIMEGAAVTGIGLSYRISNHISTFTDVLAGISLPGKGFKFTNSGCGLKVNW